MGRIKEQIKELVRGKPKLPDEENQEDQPAEVNEGATYDKGKYNRGNKGIASRRNCVCSPFASTN